MEKNFYQKYQFSLDQLKTKSKDDLYAIIQSLDLENQRLQAEKETLLELYTTPTQTESIDVFDTKNTTERVKQILSEKITQNKHDYQNMNNFCYGNAVTRALICLPNFFDYLNQYKNKNGKWHNAFKNCINAFCSDKLYNPRMSMFNLVKNKSVKHKGQDGLMKITNHTFGAHEIYEKEMFGWFSQEDAHEYLTYVLDQLHEESKKYSEREFDTTFGTNHEQDTICIVCKNVANHTTVTNYIDSLSFTPDTPIDKAQGMFLETVIKNSYEAEFFISPDKCSYCEVPAYNRKREKVQLKYFPKILILHLKRFSVKDGIASKIDKRVQIPSMLLQNGIDYRLKSIVLHTGTSINGGHFITAALNSNNTWTIFDCLRPENSEMIVQNINTKEYQKQGYLYFFEKAEVDEFCD